MSRDNAHPALHTPPVGRHQSDPTRHFVPEGWEDFDRGLCPCGEAVIWDATQDRWVVDRSLRVLVLTPDEVKALTAMDSRDPTYTAGLVETIVRQIGLQDEVLHHESAGLDGPGDIGG